MPIFDDPKKSLERMQRELLREEEKYEEEFLTEEEWLDEEIAEAKALLGMDEEDEDEQLYRNYANGYGNYRQPRRYDDFEEDEEEDEPELPPKDHRGQLALTFVLLAGIAAVAIYWVAVFL